MATLTEVRDAMHVIDETKAPVALFHCVSSYPSQPSDATLRAMDTLRREFDVPVGWSDHTDGTVIGIASVAVGAAMIEKHFTISRGLPGPDQPASLEPGELRSLVQAIRDVEASLGHGRK